MKNVIVAIILINLVSFIFFVFQGHFYKAFCTSTFLQIFIKAQILRKCRKENDVSWSKCYHLLYNEQEIRKYPFEQKKIIVAASLRKLKAGDFLDDDPKLKCYVRCILIEYGILNQKHETILKDFPAIPVSKDMQSQVQNSINKCRSIRKFK